MAGGPATTSGTAQLKANLKPVPQPSKQGKPAVKKTHLVSVQPGIDDDARFNLVRGVAVASDGMVFTAGYEGHRIRRIWSP